MISEVIVLCWNAPAASDSRVQKIVEFLGAKVTFVSLPTAALRGVDSLRKLVPSCACVIASVETLAQMANASETGVNGLRVLTDLAEHVFIHGFQPTDLHNSILRTLSSGGLLRLQPLEVSNATFRVADGHRQWCGQFSGLSLGATDPRRDASFVEGAEQERQAVLIRAGDKPFFVRVDYARSDLFFSACDDLADLDEKVPCEDLLPWFSRLVPLMMFLRGALGKRIWHNEHPRASFIIDDPLLKRRYGFLEYGRLLDAMRRKQFSTCIAFIPWNYRRSRKETTALFAASPGMSSVCVHGCDHTRAEFATMDFESLCGKAQLALHRMRAHRRLSGVLFDEVMVFPQGVFSSEALSALKACGYLAAVNSDLCPSNTPGALTLRDLMEVAVTRFANFPLFGRRYPKNPAEFAFDLFLGKPALAVEHHGYFQNGYEALESFVDKLNALEERLEWTDLTTICSRACLTRSTESGDVHLRFYGNRFWLKNHGTRPQRYLLFQPRASEGPPPSLTVNGSHWNCKQDNDHIEITLSLDAGEIADIRVSPGTRHPVAFSRKQWGVHNARVLVRRFLCEFRDNYVDTNRILSGIASSARNSRSRQKAASGSGAKASSTYPDRPGMTSVARSRSTGVPGNHGMGPLNSRGDEGR